jgi:hypothetical protein
LVVTAFFIYDTKELYKRGQIVHPAVPGHTTLKLLVTLPSIVQADPDMILSFAENLSMNLKVEHDCRSGENSLMLTV